MCVVEANVDPEAEWECVTEEGNRWGLGNTFQGVFGGRFRKLPKMSCFLEDFEIISRLNFFFLLFSQLILVLTL